VVSAVPDVRGRRPGGGGVETSFGGVFHLINLGLFLELYGDFTTPAWPGLPLPIWDFVALVGREFLGRPMEADPVWELLACLACRAPGDAPGSGFEPPDEWRLPVGWLAPFREAGRWTWSAEAGRLRVRHPLEFAVRDVARAAADPMPQLMQETQRYAGSSAFDLVRGSLPMPGHDGPPLGRWLGWLMPYVRARLGRALGFDRADELPRLLCAHPARVFVTPARLEIVSALAALPVAIRLAGLDRDPGWVPAAGRFIQFRFE
jgi:hypothetical protein